MTQQEKRLLLKDLCARLPYGVKILQGDVIIETLESICKIGDNDYTINPITTDMYNGFHVEQVKPYLRPMSSMTDKEETLFRCELPAIAKTDAQLVAMRMELFLKGHLDFNHLIEKGLALEAPEGMYKTI
jgi:hypothetical protein